MSPLDLSPVWLLLAMQDVCTHAKGPVKHPELILGEAIIFLYADLWSSKADTALTKVASAVCV